MNLAEKKRVWWVWGIVVKEISDEVTRTRCEHALIELELICGILEGFVKMGCRSCTNERASRILEVCM
jgi:hypothetical protein